VSRLPQWIKSKELDNALKSLFVFKDYLIPNKSKDAPFAQLIVKSYYYMFLSKACVVMMPLALKFGIDTVLTSQSLLRSGSIFGLYGLLNVLTTYFDGLKSRESTKVVQTAWYKMSLQAYNKLLDLDL
jgi:hypothetical protein